MDSKKNTINRGKLSEMIETCMVENTVLFEGLANQYIHICDSCYEQMIEEEFYHRFHYTLNDKELRYVIKKFDRYILYRSKEIAWDM